MSLHAANHFQLSLGQYHAAGKFLGMLKGAVPFI